MRNRVANWLRSLAERLSPTTYDELAAQFLHATIMLHLMQISARAEELNKLAEPPQWLAKAMVDDDDGA